MRIVHDRDASGSAVVVVVTDAQRVADLVRRELADAGEAPLHQFLWRLGSLLVRAEETLGNHVVRPDAQRAESHDALDDFARARVTDAAARAPAARRAVYP